MYFFRLAPYGSLRANLSYCAYHVPDVSGIKKKKKKTIVRALQACYVAFGAEGGARAVSTQHRLAQDCVSSAANVATAAVRCGGAHSFEIALQLLLSALQCTDAR